jgi:hypothetical protein
LSKLVTKSQFGYQENNNFFYKTRYSAAKTLVSLNAVYEDEALEKTAACDWYN